MKQSRVKKMIAEQWNKTLQRFPEGCEALIEAYKIMLTR